MQHFSKLSLKNTDLSEPDMLGRAYEYLIEKFADDAGKKGGETSATPGCSRPCRSWSPPAAKLPPSGR